MTSTPPPVDELQPPRYSPMEGREPLSILVVGGSLSGLFAAIPLKRLGHNVRILESASSSAREGQAAGIGLAADVKRFFDEYDRLKHIPFGIPLEEMQVLDSNLESVMRLPAKFSMTTWDATYYRLRANFDGLVSGYCPEVPHAEPGEGEAFFETGIRVLHVADTDGKMTVSAEDIATSQPRTYEADLVVAADGASSTIRRQLYPDLVREEPGFMLWRGIVPMSSLSDALVKRIEDITLSYPMQKSYLILYAIPGHNGVLEAPSRQINFAWYDWPDATTSIPEILTDTAGHTHRTTLPRGAMRPEVWAAQLQRAREMMHPSLLEVPEKLEKPFVSVISTIMTPCATAFDGRLFFIGDALVQLQPNTGQGTNHAAAEVMLLVDVFKGKISVEEWEDKVLATARKERARSIEFPRKWLYTS